MSEDNALEEAFNFLDEEDDDSDEEGEEWEDQTSSTSQLTKVGGGHTHTRTFLGSVHSPCLFTPSEHKVRASSVKCFHCLYICVTILLP